MAETTFSSVQDMVASGVRAKFDLPSFPFAPLIVFFGQLQADTSIGQVRPVDHIGRIAPRPVLLVRAGRDTWVPAHNADALFAEVERQYRALRRPGAHAWPATSERLA